MFKKEKPHLWDSVPKVPGFVGQSNLKHKLISKFLVPDLEERFLRISGKSGSGKSALVCQTISYVQERGFIQGGCIYLNCKEINTGSELIKNVIRRIRTDRSGWLEIEKNDEHRVSQE